MNQVDQDSATWPNRNGNLSKNLVNQAQLTEKKASSESSAYRGHFA